MLIEKAGNILPGIATLSNETVSIFWARVIDGKPFRISWDQTKHRNTWNFNSELVYINYNQGVSNLNT